MDEKMVSLRINDIPVTVPEGSTVLEAARSAGFNIPSLCFLKDINEIGACRICVVEVKGAKSLVASCVYPVAEGMEVYTNTERVRKLTLELILSNHRMDCLTCSRNSHCELLQLAGDLGIDAVRYANDNMPPQIEASAPHLVRDNSKCVLCRRCTAVCRKTQEVGVIGPNDRGFHTHIGCAFDRDLAEVDCVSCGQCIVACPTGAMQKDVDGTVQHDDEACIGCGACANACPYEVPVLLENLEIVGKCDACKPFRDRGMNPVCVDACNMRALEFGDLDELRAKHKGVSALEGELVRDLPILPSSEQTRPNTLINPKPCALEPEFKQMIG